MAEQHEYVYVQIGSWRTEWIQDFLNMQTTDSPLQDIIDKTCLVCKKAYPEAAETSPESAFTACYVGFTPLLYKTLIEMLKHMRTIHRCNAVIFDETQEGYTDEHMKDRRRSYEFLNDYKHMLGLDEASFEQVKELTAIALGHHNKDHTYRSAYQKMLNRKNTPIQGEGTVLHFRKYGENTY